MDNKLDIKISDEEQQELTLGQQLYETTKTPGFKVIEEKLKDMAFHSWVDPREVNNQDDYLWRELNGFHAANNARELLEWIQSLISRSQYLEKKKKGEIVTQSMRIG